MCTHTSLCVKKLSDRWRHIQLTDRPRRELVKSYVLATRLFVPFNTQPNFILSLTCHSDPACPCESFVVVCLFLSRHSAPTTHNSTLHSKRLFYSFGVKINVNKIFFKYSLKRWNILLLNIQADTIWKEITSALEVIDGLRFIMEDTVWTTDKKTAGTIKELEKRKSKLFRGINGFQYKY